VSLTELHPRETVHHLDMITRDVYLPLLSCHCTLADGEKDRFLDVFHRLLNQTAATHTLHAQSVILPLPAFPILAHIAQDEPRRQQTILSVLENTVSNWSKQVKVSARHERPPTHDARGASLSATAQRRIPMGDAGRRALLGQRPDSAVDVTHQQVEQFVRPARLAVRSRRAEELGAQPVAVSRVVPRNQTRNQPSACLGRRTSRSLLVCV
jgi:hypothetical protein